MLLDLRELIGAEAMVQVDLGERRNAHQPLDALRPMADAVLAAVVERLRREGRLAPPATVDGPSWSGRRTRRCAMLPL